MPMISHSKDPSSLVSWQAIRNQYQLYALVGAPDIPDGYSTSLVLLCNISLAVKLSVEHALLHRKNLDAAFPR